MAGARVMGLCVAGFASISREFGPWEGACVGAEAEFDPLALEAGGAGGESGAGLDLGSGGGGGEFFLPNREKTTMSENRK